MFIARIFTLYPEFFPGPLAKGLYGKALVEKIWKLETVNIRDYAEDKHKTVDDTTYGGGSGMLIKPDVLAKSLDQNIKSSEKIIYLSPKGKLFNQNLAKKLAKEKTLNLICGHFEGVDERVINSRNIEEVSIGDFVLSGGELAATILCDSIIRLIPGVIGDESSALSDSFQDDLLAPPIYTRPSNYKGWKVPDVLLSGNASKISNWREEESFKHTQERRPDLLK